MSPAESLRPYLLDASALVKLVVEEDDASLRIKKLFSQEVWFVTTFLCLAASSPGTDLDDGRRGAGGTSSRLLLGVLAAMPIRGVDPTGVARLLA